MTRDVVVDIDGRVARVMIDRVAAKNALSPAVLDGLDAALDAATAALLDGEAPEREEQLAAALAAG